MVVGLTNYHIWAGTDLYIWGASLVMYGMAGERYLGYDLLNLCRGRILREGYLNGMSNVHR